MKEDNREKPDPDCETKLSLAKARAAKAKARAERAEMRTEEAKNRTESAETRAEQAESRTESAKTRTEQAEARAEQAESELEMIAQKGATISPDEKVLPFDGHDLLALEKLTPRQREILGHIAAGENTKQIAALLEISPKTVEYHRLRLMKALDIHDVAGLVRFALRVGVTPIHG